MIRTSWDEERAAQENARKLRQEVHAAESKGRQRRETEELRRYYAAGGSTPRMDRATEGIRLLNLVLEGRWIAQAEVPLPATFRGLKVARKAAQPAVQSALDPLLEAAEAELEAATEERDRLAR
jgi:hypothetical protein